MERGLAGSNYRQRPWFAPLCSPAATSSPAFHFRESGLPAAYIGDCLSFNLRVTRDIEDIGALGHVDLLGDLRGASGAKDLGSG